MSGLLETLGHRVRSLRGNAGWTRLDLAERSGLSVRFLARVESGEGNISVMRLGALARALGTTPHDLLRPESAERPVIALVGLRGAGKSTVGPRLAAVLELPFIEIDDRIVETCGLPLDQLFELHGEPYYRRLEREILQGVLAEGQRAVVAVSGGVVNDAAGWELLVRSARVVWLRARPEDHWNRVIGQGDRRPMRGNPDAMDELRAILDARESLYSRADLVVDTSDRTPAAVVDGIRNGLELD